MPNQSFSLSEDSPDVTVIFEGMTSISALIETVSSGVSDRRILTIFFDEAQLYKKNREYRFLDFKSRELGFSLSVISSEDLSKMASGTTHGGILALATARSYPPLLDLDLSDQGFWVMLDGIEDPYNFGYSLRALYASGATGLILPPRNWLSAAGTVARASAGISEKMTVRVCDPITAIERFRSAGYSICAAEIRDSESLYETDLKKPLLFVIGGEKRGISREVLSRCDRNVRIEYGREFRGSLSAAATCAVIGFEVMRFNRSQN